MNRVQFFTDNDLPTLQLAINEWLEQHTHVQVIRTDLNTIVKPDILGNMQNMEQYIFYILYHSIKPRTRKKGISLSEPLPTEQLTVPSIESLLPEGQAPARISNEAKSTKAKK